jgi:HlyD family secretion protein
LRIAAVLAAIVAVFVLLQRTVFREKPVEVEIAAVSVGPVEDVVVNSESGTVMARSRARLGVETVGRVAEIRRREGSTARAGEIVLRLDAGTERARLLASRRNADVARATAQQASTAATLARQQHARIVSLHKQGLASQEELDQAEARKDGSEAELRAAEARRLSAEAAVLLAEDDLSHTEIRAPFDGTVAHRYVEVGEQVIPGQALLELVGLSRLYVSAPIDERDAGRLREGLPVRITLDTYPGVAWQSLLTRLSPVVEAAEAQNRTQEVEADIPPDPSKPEPSPGMTADVEIILGRREAVLRVPTFAVIDGKRVLAVIAGRAVSRQVEVGLKSWEWTEVRSGLREGDRVITSLDRAGLKDGVRVAEKRTP